MAKILFLHGLDAQPGGIKPTFLVQQGHDVLNPALPRDDFDASVRIALESIHANSPDVIVGSSRGGAVALAINQPHLPAVLLAPAWKFFLEQPQPARYTHIIHSPDDSLIPIDHSRQIAREWPDRVLLFEIGDRHTLTDPVSLARMDASVRELALQICR